ncbi:amidohydrolase family protein [uncultured Clostridium sp.]|uniref:N-acyl-D-amino-acid deacylase family protein n=1 Tax=uncultured Clostridium sp. TaxID=59620 RepID=UPI0025F2B25E|nr:D-aminoacylase [uncultured Clostridium sp.]
MDLLIKNAEIVDGTGKSSYSGAIYIRKEKIEKILKEADEIKQFEEKAERIIDAEDMVCTPGFIDTHSHSDLEVLSKPDLLPKLHQGITTEILGQDGVSMAPLPIEYIEAWKKNISGLDGKNDDIDWRYKDTDHYLKMIEKARPALNEYYLLPHGNVRMEAMGLDDREPTKEEIQRMCDITRREMENGCIGLSSGLIYMPCAYSKTEELIELCKVIKEYDGVFVVHQRSEADTILDSMKEIIEIGRKSKVHIHFSHFKVCGKNNWDNLKGMFELLDMAERENLQVSFDQYPYIAGSTMLGVILPPWVHDGGTDKLVKRLKDEELRKKMKEDIRNGIPGWDNFIEFAGTEGIYITSVATPQNQDVVGLNLDELGKKKGKDPLDAVFDLLLEEKNAVGMVDFYGTEEHVKKIIKRPEMNACTDGLLSGKPHPRVYGAFPRILGKYVRKEKILSLEEAVYKLTGKAAETFLMNKRGFIKEGYFADITIFNPKTIIDKGTFTEPEQYPEGIEYVIVNGTIALENGKEKIERVGKVIRRKEV